VIEAKAIAEKVKKTCGCLETEMKYFTMLCLFFLIAKGDCMAANFIPIHITGSWSVEVGPGSIQVDGHTIRVPHEVSFHIPAPVPIHVVNEMHSALPVFNANAGGWMKGVRLNQLITQECSATGLLTQNSVVVKSSSGGSTPFVPGRDYQLDSFWGTLGRLPDGQIKPDQPVYIDYQYTPCRLDSIAVNKNGHVLFIEGKPHVGSVSPPALSDGAISIANIWLPGPVEKLTEENIFPIDSETKNQHGAEKKNVAVHLLPNTLAKLRAGGHVTIVAWGDSVTAGGGVGNDTNLWYQNQFASMLQKRFPKASITMKSAAWPGGNSQGYLDAPAGFQYNFQRDVLDPKPDLVTIEFVNDAYMNVQQTMEHYTGIVNRLHANGSEVIFITPHLVRPDWMGVTSLKFDKDPRQYVLGLRELAAKDNIALADVSAAWCHIWREGIPYVTLLANSINHPDARGHLLFARTLIDLFPKK
jgi:lysophospholipase L1-like esterase